MPLILGVPVVYWLIGGGAAAGGTIYAASQPDTVINMPENVTQEQLDKVLNSQPKTLGDGLSDAGQGLSLAAALAFTIYILNK